MRTTQHTGPLLENAHPGGVDPAKEAQRQLRMLARQRKRQRLLDMLAEAAEAYKAGDVRLHFQMIRRLAPKTYRRRLRLKSSTGDLLSSLEERRELTKYATALF